MTDIYKRIRHMMRHKHWSKLDLALRAGVTETTLTNIQKDGHRIRNSTVEVLAEALGVSTKYLRVGGKEDNLKESHKDTVALNVKRLREERGWKIGTLQEKSDISYCCLKSIEEAKREARRIHLEKLAKTFDITLKELVGDDI